MYCFSPGKFVTAPEATPVREKVWGEIVEALRRVDPGVRTEY